MADLYGILAEFGTSDELRAAIKISRDAGYRRIEAFTPFPVEGIDKDIGFHERRVLWLGLIGGIMGATVGFLMQVYVATDYPLNVGGRAVVALPAFTVVTFELTILFAAFFTIFGMLWLNKLPRLSHPLFNVPRFHLASRDRFFLCVESRDPCFELTTTRAFLEKLKPISVSEVPL